MQDDTREHKRFDEQTLPGQRVNLSLGTLLLPMRPSAQLVIHFHGPAWAVEVCARKRYPGAAVLTVQLEGASDVYREPFADPARYLAWIAEAETVSKVKFKSVVVSSFSAGYGAVRELVRNRANWPRIDGVVLADSLHADYGTEEKDLGPFVDFAREAKTGRKFFLFSHSEVYPGTYLSTTETASFLLTQLGLKRRPILLWGTLGMQQLSVVAAGGLQILGFAGNSAPDHVDHFFALEDWYARLFPGKSKAALPATRRPS